MQGNAVQNANLQAFSVQNPYKESPFVPGEAGLLDSHQRRSVRRPQPKKEEPCTTPGAILPRLFPWRWAGFRTKIWRR
ncbi:hypothetical protein MPL1032_10287 [Mesorhizobium plurifarium]|uniref:Uncharacterized protein n=1 Tax=Mesorhizobium plurifarium TaxID=69974 RepID=A0A0K2VNI4_MESPL|nr:hypothetical protein MPL1032_10287 [Mesorhizobium plurifarium]